jgi:hypothetical protein
MAYTRTKTAEISSLKLHLCCEEVVALFRELYLHDRLHQSPIPSKALQL